MITYKCIICEKPFPKTEINGKSRSSAEVTRYFRQTDAITCSHRCSAIYMRVYNRVKYPTKIRKKQKAEELI